MHIFDAAIKPFELCHALQYTSKYSRKHQSKFQNNLDTMCALIGQ